MKGKKYIFSAYTRKCCVIWACFMLFIGLIFMILPLVLKDYSLFWLLLIEPVLALVLLAMLLERFAIADEEKLTLYTYFRKKQTIFWKNASEIVVKKPNAINPTRNRLLKNLGFLLITDTNQNSIRLPHDNKTEKIIKLYFKGEITRKTVWFQGINSIFPPREE